MNIAAQVDALRPMLLHSDFVAFISPHVRGEQRDESEFMVEVVRSLARCRWPRPHLLVDLHVEAPDGSGASDFDKRWDNVLGNIRAAFEPVQHVGPRIRVFAWPKLLNRYIFGGRVQEINGSLLPNGVRWAISTPHVARVHDDADIDPPFWSLLPPGTVTRLHSRYYDRPPLKGPVDL
jgi:hypothetical protein